MADAAAKTIHKTRVSGHNAYILADGVVFYEGQFVQLESGYLNHWDEAGTFLGILTGGKDRAGDGVLTGEISDTPPVEGYVDESGTVLMHVTIGGTPTQAKVGDLVFCADSDPANMTFTDTTNPPVGRCVRYRSATDQDVQLFTPGEFAAGIADATWNS